MLSSLSSLLPSSVQEQISKVGHSHEQALVQVHDEGEYSDGNKSDTMGGIDEMGTKKKTKKDKSASEVCRY
jgi:hypothetical protein